MASMRGSAFFVEGIGVDLAAAGHHGQQRRRTAHLFDLLELGEQIVHVELVLHQALGGGLGLLVVLERLRFLDQGKHIAHAKDAVCHPRRVERFQILELLARALEVDRLAGNGQHRKCRTAAGIAVGLGQDDAADATFSLKVLATLTAS